MGLERVGKGPKRTGAEQSVLRSGAPELGLVASQRGVLHLQRTVGNQSVQRLLQRDSRDAGVPAAPAPAPAPKPREDWAFLMGTDRPRSSNHFYAEAETYFRGVLKGGGHLVHVTSLQGVISALKSATNPVGTLYIISHAHADGTLSFAAQDGQPASTSFSQLRDAVQAGSLGNTDAQIIDEKTNIQIKGCNIGRSQLMLDEMKAAFGGKASVTAPTHEQEFGGGQEHLAGWFVEHPGTPNLAGRALRSEFEKKYPDVPKRRWDRNNWARMKPQIDSSTQNEYDGIVPDDKAAAVSAAFKAQLDQIRADKYDLKYVGRTTQGSTYQYNFSGKRFVNGTAETRTFSIGVDIPPTDEEAKRLAAADSGRPDAYKMTVKRRHSAGSRLSVDVVMTRSEWIFKHVVMTGASGQPINPPKTDTKYYGTSTATPPTPATP